MTATAFLSPQCVFRSWDANGAPLVGGLLNTYAAGTTTPIQTFTDATAATPNANPVVLNARGEASVWILPNMGYKFVLTDQYGTLIWSEDQIFNSQLLTLYGGVDTGIANAYVLNFTANFTSLVDGITVIWIPANTNTGPSTININGLGVISIVNGDGTSLLASSIFSNYPAQILIKSGKAILLNPYVAQSVATFTPTWQGVGSLGPVTYTKVGRIVTIGFPSATAVSSSTSFFLTGLPAAITPSTFTQQIVPIPGLVDNGATVTSASVAVVNGSLGYIFFYKDTSLGTWTASGNKGFLYNSIITYVL